MRNKKIGNKVINFIFDFGFGFVVQTNRLVSDVHIIIGKLFGDSLFDDDHRIEQNISVDLFIANARAEFEQDNTTNKNQVEFILIETKTFRFTFNTKIYVSNFLFVLFEKRVRYRSSRPKHIFALSSLGFRRSVAVLPKCQRERANMVCFSYLSVKSYLLFRLHQQQQHKRGWFSIDSARNMLPH